MATVSYGLKIINAYPVFDATLRIYRAAVRYLMEIAELRYEELLPITGYVSARGKQVTSQQARQQYLERLIHATADQLTGRMSHIRSLTGSSINSHPIYAGMRSIQRSGSSLPTVPPLRTGRRMDAKADVHS